MTLVKVQMMILKFRVLLGKSGKEINNGYCGMFAAMVIENLGGPTDKLYESFSETVSPGHAWITFDGRHYDAECLEGVNNANDLPFFKRLTNLHPLRQDSDRSAELL